MIKKRINRFEKIDFILILATLALCIFGLIMIKSATLSKHTNAFVTSQLKATILGIVVMLILMFIDYRIWGNLFLVIYGVMILLLGYTVFFGFGLQEWGAASWVSIAGVRFQPSEITKIAYIICIAKFLDYYKDSLDDFKTVGKLAIIAALPIVLILLQPDLGTATVYIFITLLMVFSTGISWKIIGKTILVFLCSLPILIPVIWSRLSTYQKNRILNFGDKTRDVGNTGFQYIEGEIAIGSGQLLGKGLFKGTQTQFDFIPLKHSDYIFPVIGEELGFIGGCGVILAYMLIFQRMLKISKRSSDVFGSTMVIGFLSLFLFHIWENIGMTLGLMPITGIPLPFISHGGTFQLANLACIGLILSVESHRKIQLQITADETEKNE